MQPYNLRRHEDTEMVFRVCVHLKYELSGDFSCGTRQCKEGNRCTTAQIVYAGEVPCTEFEYVKLRGVEDCVDGCTQWCSLQRNRGIVWFCCVIVYVLLDGCLWCTNFRTLHRQTDAAVNFQQ